MSHHSPAGDDTLANRTNAMNTTEQLNALPASAMIRDHLGDHHVKFGFYGNDFRWQEIGASTGEARTADEIAAEVGGTFTVLYTPVPHTTLPGDVLCPCQHNPHPATTDLHERLDSAASKLETLLRKTSKDSERTRLQGEVEGVKLATSYVAEMTR